jgi:hypothetical protein
MGRTLLFALLMLSTAAYAVPRQHVVTFGKWLPVKFFVGPDETKSIDMKVRALYVDGIIKEFTTGEPHDVTDRLLVVRRAYRVNDWLPEDARNVRWKWQRGNWLLVERQSGHVTQIKLPSFDSYYSSSSWFRDYVAYCGVSDDRSTVYAMVVQLGTKKPVLKKELGAAKGAEMPESECASPEWQRQPVRVTFQPSSGQKLTFTVRGHAADVTTEAETSNADENE